MLHEYRSRPRVGVCHLYVVWICQAAFNRKPFLAQRLAADFNILTDERRAQLRGLTFAEGSSLSSGILQAFAAAGAQHQCIRDRRA